MIHRRTFVGGSLAALSACATGELEAAPLIPRKALFAPVERWRVTVSPDGTMIAYLAPIDGVLNLWLAPLADLSAARPLTRVTDRDIGNFFQWPQDNRHVVFFREQGGDENWQAHRVDVVTGEIRALTPRGARSYVQQVSARFPGELLLAHNARDKRYFDIYRVNVATGESRPLYVNNERGFTYNFTDTQFRLLYGALSRDDGGVDLLDRNADGSWSPFRRIDMEDAMTTRMIEIADDGSELYWLDSRGRERAAVVAENLATGRRRPMAVDGFADLGAPLLDPVTTRPIAAPATYAFTKWKPIDAQSHRDLERLEAGIEGKLTTLNVSNDRKSWIAMSDPDGRPGVFYHYDRPSGAVRKLFSSRPSLDNVPLATTEPTQIRSRDGLLLVSYLTRPRGSVKGKPGPMVLLVHGGPWFRDFPGFNANHQWLANRGYVVLSVNFRGSTGFGKAFVNAANREWAGKMHDDLIDAVDWAVAEGIADPRRVAIMGTSYGGYSALVGVTFTPEKFACAVDLVGISNLNTFINSIPPYWMSWRSVWKARMGDYDTPEGRRFLAERSPVNYVDRIVRPLLIGQGANDVRVVQAESEQIVAAMQRRGIPVTYLLYRDEGHGFYRQENRRSWNAVVEAFLGQHLGGRVEPVGGDFKGSSIEFRAGRELIRGLD